MDTTTVHVLFVFVGCGLEITISSNMVRLPPPGRSQARWCAFAAAGFVAGCGSGTCHRSLAAPTVPRDHQRSSNTKTGVRSYHNPHHQSKGESAKHLATHEEKHEYGEESQTAGQNGPRQSLIDGLVDHRRKVFFAQQSIIFADAVENHDGIVH